MRVRFVTTTADVFNSGGIDIINGQIIALKDVDKYFYDMNNKRHEVCRVEFLRDSTPEVPYNDSTLYIINDSKDKGVFIYNTETKALERVSGINKIVCNTVGTGNTIVDIKAINENTLQITKGTMVTFDDVVTNYTNGLMTPADKEKLNTIETGAEENQNAYTKIDIIPDGGTVYFENNKTDSTVTISAKDKESTLEIGIGNNISAFASTTNNNISLTSKNTTYTNATLTSDGLMSSEDKNKLNNIEDRANRYELPNATKERCGGVIVGDGINVSNGKISVTGDTHTHTTEQITDLPDLLAENSSVWYGYYAQITDSISTRWGFFGDIDQYGKGIADTEIAGESNKLYVDRNTNMAYMYKGNSFIAITATAINNYVFTGTGTFDDYANLRAYIEKNLSGRYFIEGQFGEPELYNNGLMLYSLPNNLNIILDFSRATLPTHFYNTAVGGIININTTSINTKITITGLNLNIDNSSENDFKSIVTVFCENQISKQHDWSVTLHNCNLTGYIPCVVLDRTNTMMPDIEQTIPPNIPANLTICDSRIIIYPNTASGINTKVTDISSTRAFIHMYGNVITFNGGTAYIDIANTDYIKVHDNYLYHIQIHDSTNDVIVDNGASVSDKTLHLNITNNCIVRT